MNKFGERLRELRIDKGFSQAELSKELEEKVTQSAIALWELNKRVPNADAIILFAKYFNVTSDYLLGLSDDI